MWLIVVVFVFLKVCVCGPLTSFVVVFLSDLLVHVKHDVFVLVLSCFNSTIFTNKHFL